MDKDKILDYIFNDDSQGLLKFQVKQSNVQTPDDRLLESFHKINDFIVTYGHEPKASVTKIAEFQLYSRLKSLRNDPAKVEILKEFDVHNILPEISKKQRHHQSSGGVNTNKRMSTIDDILDDDTLDILDEEGSDLFVYQHIPKEEERASADFIARRKPCKDFSNYEPFFKQVHKDLVNEKRKLIRFKQGNLREGEFYVHNGILFLLEKIRIDTKEHYKPDGTRVREDGRTRCIFENGTESNMLKRSVEKILYANGYGLTQNVENTNQHYIESFTGISDEDRESGYIYILKSKSKDERVASIPNLYKIGYATNVEERIKAAEKQPTYLMAPVEYLAGWKCYNMNPQKFEQLIHNFFGNSCLEVDVFDEDGKRHSPREWFIAPLVVIELAIELIVSGKIIEYRFDSVNRTIIPR